MPSNLYEALAAALAVLRDYDRQLHTDVRYAVNCHVCNVIAQLQQHL